VRCFVLCRAVEDDDTARGEAAIEYVLMAVRQCVASYCVERLKMMILRGEAAIEYVLMAGEASERNSSM